MALNPSLELKGLGTPNPHTMGLGTRDAYPVDTEAVNDLTAFSERAEALVQEEKLVRAKHTSSMKLEEDETKMAKEEHARIQMDIRLNGTDAHQAALVALRERATTAEQRAAAAKLQENADPNNKPPSPIAKLLSTVPGLQPIQPIPYGYAAAAIETPPRAVERPAPIVLNGSSMLENSRRGSNPTPPQDMDEEPEASSPLAFEEQPDGWNVTSMHIDSEKQAAIKIQAIGRGVSSRKVTFEALPSSEAAMAWLVAAVLLFAAAWAAAILASVPAVAPTPPPPALPNGPLMRMQHVHHVAAKFWGGLVDKIVGF